MTHQDGDFVFAKVKGYPAWPARITSTDVSGGVEKHSVIFYGTYEFATLTVKNIWKYNQVFKNKFADKIHMRNKKFARAIHEIENNPGKILPSFDDRQEVYKDREIGKTGHGIGSIEVEENQENTEGVEVAGKGVEHQSAKSKDIATAAKKGKEKTKKMPLRNTNRNLQEDEVNNIKQFREKIVEDGKGYSCRLCEFASGNRILAKTHATQCGKFKQTRRKKPKLIHCIECAEEFTSKVSLDKHFKIVHATSSYICSTCGFRTGTRNNYMKHLRCHDRNYSPSFKCDFCNFKAKDNWHLDKHSLSHFKNTNSKNLNTPMATFCAMKVEVSLTEFQFSGICRSMYEMSITRAAGDLTPVDPTPVDPKVDWDLAAVSSLDCFGNLGLCKTDWAEWLEISNCLGLGSVQGFYELG